MRRKRDDQVIQVNLRIPRGLQRRLEQEAKQRGVSVNFEMMSRIQHSFADNPLRSLEEINQDMQIVWLNFSAALMQQRLREELAGAVKGLIAGMEPAAREALHEQIAAVNRVTAIIEDRVKQQREYEFKMQQLYAAEIQKRDKVYAAAMQKAKEAQS